MDRLLLLMCQTKKGRSLPGGEPDDRKSTSGCVFLLQGGPISWFSRKQECKATSTTDAEFVAGSEAAKEGTWIKSLLVEIGQG